MIQQISDYLVTGWAFVGLLLAFCVVAVVAALIFWVLGSLTWWLTVLAFKRLGVWKVWLQMKRLHRPFMTWLAEQLRQPPHDLGYLPDAEWRPDALVAMAKYDPRNNLKWRGEPPADV